MITKEGTEEFLFKFYGALDLTLLKFAFPAFPIRLHG